MSSALHFEHLHFEDHFILINVHSICIQPYIWSIKANLITAFFKRKIVMYFDEE